MNAKDNILTKPQAWAAGQGLDLVSPGAAIERFGIECKFSESYGSYGHSGIAECYLSDCQELWHDLPNLKAFAQTISPDDRTIRFLHPMFNT